MKTIIYVHGYDSSILSSKVEILNKNLPREYNIVGETYNYDSQSPYKIIKRVEDFSLKFLRTEEDQIFFIGSSLGGFIVLNVLKHINAKAVLVNPSLSPHVNMIRRNNKFSKEYAVVSSELNPHGYKNVLALISTDDDVIDMEKIKSFNFKKEYVNGGGHSMTTFDSQMKTILNYFENSNIIEEHGLFLD
jgi:predicted esterase YcpF (UPF0227 family)